MSLFAQLPTVVSYYTKNTPYEKEVLNLIASCEEFGIDYLIEGVEDGGSWEKNCALKPHFLQEKFRQLGKPVLWVDADAVFLRPMEFEEFMFCDLAVFFDEKQTDPRFKVRAGTLYVNGNQKGLEALELWRCQSEKIRRFEERDLPFQDQVGLYFSVLANPGIRIGNLPLKYCKVFDEDSGKIDPSEVVIEHRQASRRFHTKKDDMWEPVNRSLR